VGLAEWSCGKIGDYPERPLSLARPFLDLAGQLPTAHNSNFRRWTAIAHIIYETGLAWLPPHSDCPQDFPRMLSTTSSAH